MTIKHLRIFLEIVNTGSMSKAAQSLHFSQPTLSQITKELEEHYGGSLFFRESHGLSLTERGHLLAKEGRQLLDSFDALEHTMVHYEQKQQEGRSYPYQCQGIDYEKASLSSRELFSFTKTQQEDFYLFLRTKPEVSGGILLSTCNRMELFISWKQDCPLTPFSLIAEFLAIKEDEYTHLLKNYTGKEVLFHLCYLSSGLKSQIFGEDQIITQVKLAQTMARSFQVTDSYLEVLFRLGITCGKKIRTELHLTQRDTSMSHQVARHCKELGISSVLVIGNGEMARHVSEILLANSCRVTMSVRRYKHTEVALPRGVEGIDYEKIYQCMPKVEGIISATLSPHFTIDYKRFQELSQKPKYLFDLAVPRDIDPNIGEIPEIKLWNVDDLSQGAGTEYQEDLLKESETIAKKYEKELDKWIYYKEKGGFIP